MSSSTFSIIAVMETEVSKMNMHLGYLDNDGLIQKEVFRQLNNRFPEDVYTRTELYDSYVFSVKGDLPAKPLLLLCKGVQSLNTFTHYNGKESQWRDIAATLDKATISQAISISQHNYFYMNLPFTKFWWLSFESWLHLDTSRNAFLNKPLMVTKRGIQLYLSPDPYYLEFGGEFRILSHAIRNTLCRTIGPENPFIDMLVVQSIDI